MLASPWWVTRVAALRAEMASGAIDILPVGAGTTSWPEEIWCFAMMQLQPAAIHLVRACLGPNDWSGFSTMAPGGELLRATCCVGYRVSFGDMCDASALDWPDDATLVILEDLRFASGRIEALQPPELAEHRLRYVTQTKPAKEKSPSIKPRKLKRDELAARLDEFP